MTTRKLVTIIVVVLTSIALLVGVFAVGIAGLVFYQIGNSDAAMTAKNFLRNNERLQQDLGPIKDFGWIISGSISVQNSAGYANLSLKAVGERRSANTNVELMYKNGRPWQVTAASYKNAAGQTVDLLNAYNSRLRRENEHSPASASALYLSISPTVVNPRRRFSLPSQNRTRDPFWELRFRQD